jgi:hypothetical protein
MARYCDGKNLINTLENSRSVRALEMYVNGTKIIGCETFAVLIQRKGVLKHWVYRMIILSFYPDFESAKRFF